MDAIQSTLSQLQQMFVQRMDTYQSELEAAAPSVNVASLTADFTAFRSFIMTALRSLHDQVGSIAQHVDNLEMRSRRKILLLHGIPEVNNEVAGDMVVKTVVDKLKVSEFSSVDISRCHRMGRKSNPDRPRPILVKLRQMELRNKLWQAKTELKGSGVTMSEFLTKSRHNIFTAARQKFGVNKSWSREGVVFVLGVKGERHRINTIAELEKIPSTEISRTAASRAAKEQTAFPKSKRTVASKK